MQNSAAFRRLTGTAQCLAEKLTWTPKVCRIIAFYGFGGPLFYLLLGV